MGRGGGGRDLSVPLLQAAPLSPCVSPILNGAKPLPAGSACSWSTKVHFLQASSSLGRFLLLTIWVLQVIFGIRGPKCPVECGGLWQKPGGQGELWMGWDLEGR